jgi:tetratricopeptide (TPR) repeat protein
MSLRPWTCEKCQREGIYLGIEPGTNPADGGTYGVAWNCPSCKEKTVDRCPLGPLLPDESLCLNCGRVYCSVTPQTPCQGCGLTRSGVQAYLGLEEVFPEPWKAARTFFNRGLFRRGLAVLNQALQVDPTLVKAWLVKCTFLEGLGLKELAAEMLEGALTRGAPDSLLIPLAGAWHRAGRNQEAARASRIYLEKHPDGDLAAGARTNLGLSLRRLGNDEGAEDQYRLAIQSEPKNVLHYRNLAQLLMDQGRWAGARGILEAGLALASRDEERIRFLEGLAFVFAEEERAEQALKHIEMAMTLGADGTRIRYLRGRALALLGRLGEAKQETLHVLELEPGNQEARQALEMIERALAPK